MRFRRILLPIVLTIFMAQAFGQSFPDSMKDPVLQKIIEIGQNDNKTMVWLDYLSNRFGGRYIGSDAYENASKWAAYMFTSWGVQVELQEVGEMPVGFNRGPWFGKMTRPEEKSLYFGTPSYTAGTKGIQRGAVIIAPDDSLKILKMKEQFAGKWVLISEAGDFGKRSGRRLEDPFLEDVLEDAGALGTILRVPVPITILNAKVKSWEHLPTLPDIRLCEADYDDIKARVEAGEEVELEFEIRNWFKMGPVKYHNVIAWIPGSECPDEYIILSGHLDAFDGGTGAVDCGSGVTPAMEAARLLALSGAKPKRTIMFHLFAGEEAGILGASAWVKANPSKHEKIGVLLNRDYRPGAVVGMTVPPSWEEDFLQVTKPLKGLNDKFPFEGVEVNPYPGIRSTSLRGSDVSAFSMAGIPYIWLKEETDYEYRRAWHTLWDTYNEVVPYSEHQEHTALCLAVMAYGLGNLDHPLSRAGVYLNDGLYADIHTDKGRIMARLNAQESPAAAEAFVQLFDDPANNRGWWRPRGPAIGVFGEKKGAAILAKATADKVVSRAVDEIKKEAAPALRKEKAALIGLAGATQFVITTKKRKFLDASFMPLGEIIAGFDIAKEVAPGDSIKAVRILRVGDEAEGF